MNSRLQWFLEARYGLFIHYGLYALLGRGEWAMNRERIPRDEYARLADRFTADRLDFDKLLGRAANVWGMRYAVLTTKHHEGFCLYDSQLTDFTAPKTACGRDLVAEFVDACRKHDLRIGLYHTLNEWFERPNGVEALEDPAAHAAFLERLHGQIREIMTNYGKIDTMWYDGWWPFDEQGWQGEKMNAMVRELQPDIIFNCRNCANGDFSTPEGHITPASGAWEGCMTLNDHWGYHAGDHNWKPAAEVADMLRQCSAGGGNLLLNIGPRGDGSIPEASVEILDQAGAWLEQNEEAIFGTDRCLFDQLERRPGDRGDWTAHGQFTAAGNNLYWHIRHRPGDEVVLGGLETKALAVEALATGAACSFDQTPDRLIIRGVPPQDPAGMPLVLRIRCDAPPSVYNCGGYRIPNVPHCRYDPAPSEVKH